ncbi:MAG: PASTA domain-containing protein [Gemmatimonadetes bacterium]|nr:PASTA domain-containing protein [Gemmatimonadota bacterium]
MKLFRSRRRRSLSPGSALRKATKRPPAPDKAVLRPPAPGPRSRDREAPAEDAGRSTVLLVLLMLVGATVIGRAAQVQLVEHREWSELAARQHIGQEEALAPRGRILAREGTPIAISVTRYSVGISPRELREAEAAIRLLSAELGLDQRRVRKAVESDRLWVVLPGRYSSIALSALNELDGVYLLPEISRHLPQGELARHLIGQVSDGTGLGGIEQAFDSFLEGTPGREMLVRDGRRREIPGRRVVVVQPEAGLDVVTTIDLGLQEIALQAIDEAILETGAVGGDIVMADPRTGEILALASRRDGAASLAAVTTPFEPGSTLKPITVAGLLEREAASLDDSVEVNDGRWTINGRTLHDVGAQGAMTVADALRISSNVGVAKAAQALSPGAQYELLRDFGLGTPTGIELPGEVSGMLRRPEAWTAQSAASLAIGYEVSVTSIQLAMAYSALANGGRLMKPLLVREVRDRNGAVVASNEPAAVRRPVSAATADAIMEVLTEVVEDGTATAARLASFKVAGKSGTARLYDPDRGYEDGAYSSSFVGAFPAEAPQLLIVVKLERPQGEYYGGAVAAPVTRAAMQAILASREQHLDRRALLAQAEEGRPNAFVGRSFRSDGEAAGPRFTAFGFEGSGPSGSGSRSLGSPPIPEPGVVPKVEGLEARVAARRLHAAGLRIVWAGSGRVVGTVPTAGEAISRGDTVRIMTRGSPWAGRR